MADSNVAVTAGSGTEIDTRTEATNGHHRQVVVLGDPATNAGVAPVDVTEGLAVYSKTNATSLGKAEDAAHTSADTGVAVLGVRRDAKAVGSGTDGDYSTINVNANGDVRVDGGDRFTISAAPAVTAGAYTAGDVFGVKMTLTDAARVSGGGGTISAISMFDEGANTTDDTIDVFIFSSDPSGSTFTDNAALAIVDADGPKIVGCAQLNTQFNTGDGNFQMVSGLNMPYVCSGTANLFAVAVTRGTWAPDATDGITFTFHLERD